MTPVTTVRRWLWAHSGYVADVALIAVPLIAGLIAWMAVQLLGGTEGARPVAYLCLMVTWVPWIFFRRVTMVQCGLSLVAAVTGLALLWGAS